MTNKLDSYLFNYTTFNTWLIKKRYQHLSQYFVGDTCLELGCGDGSGTRFLVDHFDEVFVVDGSSVALTNVSELYPQSHIINSSFEEMDFDTKFDTIILAHILEHVDDPQAVLHKTKRYLAPGGVLIVDVPNGDSLHRQIGVKMGLLSERTELNDIDLSIGHQRVYSFSSFRKEMLKTGFESILFGGMFLKILSNQQTEQVFSEQQLDALFGVGLDNPEISAEIYAVLS